MKLWKWLRGRKVSHNFKKFHSLVFSHLIRLSETYNFDFLADFEEKQVRHHEENKVKKFCGNCQKEAEKKCSRCEVVFYCSR
jgi:hypothetical protein